MNKSIPIDGPHLFKVSEVKCERPDKKRLIAFDDFVEELIKKDHIEGIADESSKIRDSNFTDNGFISALDAAFNNHCPLAFSPGQIHICLIQLLGRVINQNPDKYRNTFINHEGKKTITIRRDQFGPPGSKNDWAGTIPDFENEIGSLVKPGVKENLSTKFSSTTAIENVCRGGAIMSAFQSYFSYVDESRCGIPIIKLLGSTEDWLKLRKIGENIADYISEEEPTGKWKQKLLEMLDEFVNASRNKPNVKWWKSLYHADDVSAGVIIDGHVLTLFPILREKYAWRFDSGRNITSFSSTIVSAPFIWKYCDTEIPMSFMTGMFGTTTTDDDVYYTPYLNMVIVRKS